MPAREAGRGAKSTEPCRSPALGERRCLSVPRRRSVAAHACRASPAGVFAGSLSRPIDGGRLEYRPRGIRACLPNRCTTSPYLDSIRDDTRDAYVQGCDLALTLYPGAVDAFDRAIAADPGFAMAHAAKAQVLMREGKVNAARSTLAEATDLAVRLPAREASVIAFFDMVFAGPYWRRDRRTA